MAWGPVKGTVRTVHRNGGGTADVTTASGHTVRGVAFTPADLKKR